MAVVFSGSSVARWHSFCLHPGDTPILSPSGLVIGVCFSFIYISFAAGLVIYTLYELGDLMRTLKDIFVERIWSMVPAIATEFFPVFVGIGDILFLALTPACHGGGW